MHEEPREPEQHVDVIGDPVKVSTKGAPKQSTTGRAKKDPNVTKMEDQNHFLRKNPVLFVAFVRKRAIDGKRALRMKSKFFIFFNYFLVLSSQLSDELFTICYVGTGHKDEVFIIN